MTASPAVHRTAHLRLRLTPRQVRRCYGLLRSAGDVWAWLLDTNRQRHWQGEAAISNYQALCRLLTGRGPFGELSTVGARSVLKRYSDAWFQAANRRGRADKAGFPRPGPGPVLPRHLHHPRPAGTAAGRQRPPRAVGATGTPPPLSARAGPRGDAARRWGVAVVGGHRHHPHPTGPRHRPRSGGGGRSWHHPPLRGRHSGRGAADVGAGDPRRELSPPSGSAAPPHQGSSAGTQTGSARLAPLAAPSGPSASCGGSPSPSRPPGAPRGRHTGGRLRRPAAGRDPGGRRPQGNCREERGSHAESPASAVAPHSPASGATGQGRAGGNHRAAGG